MLQRRSRSHASNAGIVSSAPPGQSSRRVGRRRRRKRETTNDDGLESSGRIGVEPAVARRVRPRTDTGPRDAHRQPGSVDSVGDATRAHLPAGSLRRRHALHADLVELDSTCRSSRDARARGVPRSEPGPAARRHVRAHSSAGRAARAMDASHANGGVARCDTVAIRRLGELYAPRSRARVAGTDQVPRQRPLLPTRRTHRGVVGVGEAGTGRRLRRVTREGLGDRSWRRRVALGAAVRALERYWLRPCESSSSAAISIARAATS